MRDLTGLHPFEREAQTGFVLPAHLDRGQRLAVETEAVIEQLESVFNKFARHLHDIFLLNGSGIVGQLARHAKVLGEHRQTTGMRLQRCALRQFEEVLLEKMNTGTIIRCARVSAKQLLDRVCIHVRIMRLVKQDGHRLHRNQRGIGMQLDLLRRHHELRFFHHLPVHLHPAARNIQLRLAARAGDQFGEAFGETDGVGHVM